MPSEITTSATIDRERVDLIVKAAKENAATILALRVVDAATHARAAEVLEWAAKARKALADERKAVNKPLADAIERVASWFTPAEQELAAGEQHLRKEIAEYTTASRERNMRALTTGAAMVEVAHDPRLRIVPKVTIEIVDRSLIPAEYLVPDTAKLLAVAKAGVEVPGVKRIVTNTTQRTGGRKAGT